MANINSKEKNIKRIKKRTIRNRAVKSQIKTAIKCLKTSIANKNDEKEIKILISKAHKEIDKGVSKGVLHKNTGSRKKSRLDAFIKKSNIIV